MQLRPIALVLERPGPGHRPRVGGLGLVVVPPLEGRGCDRRRRVGAVHKLDAAGADGDHIGQRAPLDAETRVVLLGLEHQQRRVGAKHAVLDRQLDRLLLEHVLHVGIRAARLAAIVQVQQARDPRLDPRALEQRAIHRRQRAGQRQRLAVRLHAQRLAGGQVGVDQNLVTRLHAVQRVRPDPAGAVDLQLDAGARGARQPMREHRRRLGRVEHHAVAREPRGHQLAEQRVLADAADREHVEAFDARAGERLHALAQLRAAGLARGGHAVGDQQDAGAPARRGAHVVGRPAQRALEIRRAQRAPFGDAAAHDVAERARPPGEDRRHVLIERRHGQHRVGAGLAQLRDQAIPGRELVGEPERARRAGVDQYQQRRDVVATLAVGERHDARHDQVLIAQAQSAAVAGVRDLEVAVGPEAVLVDLDDLALHAFTTQARRGAAARRGFSDQGADRQVVDPGQPTQRQAVRLVRARQLLRVRDDQLLGRRRRDREDARREFVARFGLQQRRVLAPVQEILVRDARRLLLDDLALLPAIAHAHREAADGRARRQRDAEAPLARAVLRVAEREVQLGERQRIVDHRLRGQ